MCGLMEHSTHVLEELSVRLVGRERRYMDLSIHWVSNGDMNHSFAFDFG